MKINLERKDNDFHFVTTNERGHEVHIDHKGKGGDAKGSSPMELLLMGVAGCSAIDVVSILKKQRQEITSYKADVRGNRIEGQDASPFTDIYVTVFLEGDIKPEKAKRATKLSFEKYCSVSKTLEPTAKIHYNVVLNGKEL